MTSAPKPRRLPAEWEPHAATWFAWPHCCETWPQVHARIPAVWAAMIRALAPGEDIHILVNDAGMESAARAVLREHAADAPNVNFHHVPTDDAWLRDTGPIFVKAEEGVEDGGEIVALDWEFNSWGRKYPPWDRDNAVPRRIADILAVPAVSPGMVLEGGSIDVNGAGLLLTTEQCLLNPNRNPGLSRREIEERLREHLGVETIIWLGQGIAGDDTDGHVDDVARFVAEDVVVAAVEHSPADENHAPLAENRRRLEAAGLTVIALPMPHPVHARGERLPASHANFHIGNAAVLVPIFGDTQRDGEALEILRGCFPSRDVVGIPSRDLVIGLGACHCVTHQQPR